MVEEIITALSRIRSLFVITMMPTGLPIDVGQDVGAPCTDVISPYTATWGQAATVLVTEGRRGGNPSRCRPHCHRPKTRQLQPFARTPQNRRSDPVTRGTLQRTISGTAGSA